MSLPLIYIAGKFRGPTPLDVRRNVEAARDLGMLVASMGAYPVIPHTMTADFDKQLTDEFWLEGTMEMLRRCDALVATSNWVESTGARAEVHYAIEETMPTFTVVDRGIVRMDTAAIGQHFIQWLESWHMHGKVLRV